MRLGQNQQNTDSVRHHKTRGVLCTLVVTCLACVAGGQEFVPFVIPARIDPQQPIWVADAQPIRTDAPRLKAGEHFYRDDGAVRIWGVNLCFGANFPTHEDAPHVAQRLAAAGVNSVRCHHLDTSRWPRGIWNSRDGKTIEPQALDRLDFLINELARCGICVNLNLHVGRDHSRYLGLPQANTDYDKIVGIFTPALIEAQKQYARELLTHVNPYRKVRWADDPAVAFVEITNEDSFFMWDGEQKLRTLPPYYGDILRGRFTSWLNRQYGSDEALRVAWAKGTQPLGESLLRNGAFAAWDKPKGVPENWNLERHEDCQASLSQPPDLPGNAVRVEIGKANSTEWHLQLTQGGFAITAGQYYTVSFEAWSPQPRQISCGVSQAHSPWENLGFSRRVELSGERKTFTFGFVAGKDDDNARISFAFSGSTTPFNLGQVTLRPGGQVGLAEGESPGKGNIALFQENESTPRILDRMTFLAETEKAYFDDMRSYIRNDLGCGALVTGTIVFGPLGLYAQSDMDFIDAHAYWQHPRFPGRPWDPANWLIDQKPMTDYPDQATLFRLAAERLAGKPFTVSEYNHPAPLDAQAECVPMIASFAAAQDWDGIWLFTYSHATDDWGRESMSGFFDMDTNPAKWGFMRAGAAVFARRQLVPLHPAKTVEIAQIPNELSALAALHLRHSNNMLGVLTSRGGIASEDMLRTRIAPSYTNVRPPEPSSEARSVQLKWSVNPSGHGIYQAVGSQTQVYTGHAECFDGTTRGTIRIASPDFVALTITPLEESAQLLVTACGRCENTDMVFSQDRRTVGRNWGKAPVQVEAVRGNIVLPEGRWMCHTLAPDGSRKQQVPVAYENGRGTLALSPKYKTMWYLLERQTSNR